MIVCRIVGELVAVGDNLPDVVVAVIQCHLLVLKDLTINAQIRVVRIEARSVKLLVLLWNKTGHRRCPIVGESVFRIAVLQAPQNMTILLLEILITLAWQIAFQKLIVPLLKIALLVQLLPIRRAGLTLIKVNALSTGGFGVAHQ